MRYHLQTIILVISLISCNQSKDDSFIGEYYTLLPVKVGIHSSDTVYTLDFSTIVLILQGKGRRSQYDALDFYESYIFGIQVYKDSISGRLLVDLAYNLDNSIILFADTASSMVFREIGPFPVADIHAENVVSKKDYLQFDVVTGTGEDKLDYQVALYIDGLSTNIMFPDSIFGRVNTELNPLYLRTENGMLIFKTLDIKTEVDLYKHMFYSSNYEFLKDSIEKLEETNPTYHIIENSLDYLKRCIALYELNL